MSMVQADDRNAEECFNSNNVNDNDLNNDDDCGGGGGGDGDGDDGCTPYIIRIRGLPWNTTKQEICDFFDGVNIVNGEHGIHLVTLATSTSKPLGEAYIELASSDDMQLAQSFHKKNLGTRYIEVFEATVDEFESIMSKQRGAQDETVVRLRGLPWDATESDIAEFFNGLQIKSTANNSNGIHIAFNKNGKASGEAYLQFQTVEDMNQALKRNMEKLGHRYIEIFRSTEQQMMKSIMQNSRNSYGGGGGGGGGRMNNGNFNSNGNNRMHPYDRNGRGNNNARGRNQNMRNDFRRDRRSDGDNFMQNAGQSNNRNFGNRSFNAMDGGGSGNGNTNSNFYDDFDLNEFAKNINTLDRLVNMNRNQNSRQNFAGNSGNDNNFSGNSNWMRNQAPQAFNSRGGGGGGNNMSSFGGSNRGFNNDCSNDQDDNNRTGQHCIHMRGLPYYTDEMDVFNFFAPLKPSFCKIIINKKGLHSGEAKAYFDSYEQVRTAMNKDRMKMGSRYIELFYGGSN